MNYSRRVEANLAEFYELVPNLPKHVRVWLANHAWRVVLVGIVFCIIGVFWLIPTFFASLVLTPWIGKLLSPAVPYVSNEIDMTWVSLFLGIIVFVITAVILSSAVNAIRRSSRAGWDGLYKATALNIGLGVVVLVLTPSWEMFVTLVVGALITGYLLFEIRTEFHYVVRSQTAHTSIER